MTKTLLAVLITVLAIPATGSAHNIQSRCPQGYHLTKGHYTSTGHYIKAHCTPNQ